MEFSFLWFFLGAAWFSSNQSGRVQWWSKRTTRTLTYYCWVSSIKFCFHEEEVAVAAHLSPVPQQQNCIMNRESTKGCCSGGAMRRFYGAHFSCSTTVFVVIMAEMLNLSWN
eukprot:c21129_g1_i3 orf=1257-1592(+)